MYQPRTYRHWIDGDDLVSFQVVEEETDLFIRVETNLKRKAVRLVSKYRDILKRYIGQHPEFLTAENPLPFDDAAPNIVKVMMEAAEKTGVGPMAAVAGAIAEFVGGELAGFSSDVIVENGGDIYIKSLRKRKIAVYAATSSLTGKIGVEIAGRETPLGVCTSSGTVGHSLSYGQADAVIAISPSTALADAAATAIGNLIKRREDIPDGIDHARGIKGLKGVIIVVAGELGVWGEVKLCRT